MAIAPEVSDTVPSHVPHTSATDAAGLRILIVDDETTNRIVLQAMLTKDGHTVLSAEDGQMAVDLFDREQPDMVLMDVMMPGMNGYEATRQIKAHAGERFVPVIFLTAMQTDEALVECVAAGGDDFLTKPYKRQILRAKVRALQRVRQLYTALQVHKDNLAAHHARLQREQEVAQKVFARVVKAGSLDTPHIRYVASPVSIFNGDILVAATTPSGGLHVMVGDFTGHGLSAALGAMPVSEIFYSMTAKGYAISDILEEVNQKLRGILPTGLFCAACFLAFDADYRTLSVWNGGLPDVLLHHHEGLRYLASQHLPLGVVDNDRLDKLVDIYALAPGERVYAYTDGLPEAQNPAGDMFGAERLAACFARPAEQGTYFDTIRRDLSAFRAGAEQHDDLTLIEITCDAALAMCNSAQQTRQQPAKPPARWRMTLELDADALRMVDPLPQLMQMLMEIQGLGDHRERLYTILAELFTNALDHGLLGLDSRLKHSPQGFLAYYTERAQRLAALDTGQIAVAFTHTPHTTGGALCLRLEDSGPGFDYAAIQQTLAANTGYCGRGLPLVQSLCQHVTYHGCGNIVEAVYTWE